MVAFDYKKTPITQIADYIIMYSAKSGASDIHFDPRDNGLMVRIRIDGELQDYTLIPQDYERNLITRLKLLANMNITESRLPQDGAIKGMYGDQYLDMRASCLPTNEGEKFVIRILDYSRSLEGLEHLGFSKVNFLKLERMIKVPNGIILVTGATGTGKSTTTYSILQELNTPDKNIITVEDPVEMNIEGLNQVQVNSEIGLDFATVLRSILRQDPNIILIGEIRDSETAQIAVRASITGHLVLSTIHTNDSLSTIERLLDMDVERYLLSSALTGIISQRLAKKLCPKCRIKKEASKYEQKVFSKILKEEITELYIANEKGCNECHKGYKGRIAIQEVLEIDEQIRNALNNEHITKEEMQYMVYTSNVITLLQDGLMKVLEGITTFDEIYRIIEIDSDIVNSTSAELAQSNEQNQETIENEKQITQTKQTTNSDVSSNIKSFIPNMKYQNKKIQEQEDTQEIDETDTSFANSLNNEILDIPSIANEDVEITFENTPTTPTEENNEESTATLTEENDEEGTATLTEENDEESTATLTEENDEESTATLMEENSEESTATLTEEKDEEGTATLMEEKDEEGTATLTEEKDEEGTATLTEENDEEGTATLMEEKGEESTATLTEENGEESTATLMEENDEEGTATLMGENDEESTATLMEEKDEESIATLTEDNDGEDTTTPNKKDNSLEEKTQLSAQASLFNPSIDKNKKEEIILKNPSKNDISIPAIKNKSLL